MTKINTPKEMLPKEAFRSFPAKEKEEYLSNLLKKILEINPEGITISQIKEATGLTYSTIWHHLEVLSCTAQCQKLSRGNLDVYYPEGIIRSLNEYNKGKMSYSVGIVKNKDGSFACIHEKKENRQGNLSICSGVSIPSELIEDIIKSLNKINKIKEPIEGKK